MRRIDTDLPGVWVIEPRIHGDERGFFLETYHQQRFAELGITCPFVQDNHSRSQRGVLRGLHFQLRQAQDKLVRVIAGAIWDVVVDLRPGSPTRGRWTAVELNAHNHCQLFVPKGCAHGFLVLSDMAEVCYKCSDFYLPEAESGLAWDDPSLAIDWPLDGTPVLLSAKDRQWPALGSALAAVENSWS